MPEVYQSKSFNDSEKTIFLTADGAGTMMEGTEGISIEDVTDGTLTTIFVLEVNPENAVIWTKPEDLPFDPENPAKAGRVVPVFLFQDRSFGSTPENCGITVKVRGIL